MKGCAVADRSHDRGRDQRPEAGDPRECSESIGANLKLRSCIGGGTGVEVEVPGKVAFHNASQRLTPRRLPWLNRGRFTKAREDQRKS